MKQKKFLTNTEYDRRVDNKYVELRDALGRIRRLKPFAIQYPFPLHSWHSVCDVCYGDLPYCWDAVCKKCCRTFCNIHSYAFKGYWYCWKCLPLTTKILRFFGKS